MSVKPNADFKWTLEEDAWFRVAAAEFILWMAGREKSKAEANFFVQRTLTAWYNAFPERHPRTYRQHSTTAEQASRVILGSEMLRMHERVRHKLNYNKRLVSAEELNRESERLIDLTTGALALRETEGYRHILASSPYGPDTLSGQMGDLAGHRLARWKSEDYSAATDSERAEVLRDLPLDMEEIVSTLATHTGAEFYMLAAWHGGGRQGQYFDVVSDRSKGFSTRGKQSLQSFRDSFLDHSLTTLGTRLSIEMNRSGSTVYGIPDGSYRPWLPRWFEGWQGLNAVCLLFIVHTADWQGIIVPSSWTGVRQSNALPVDPKRLPDGFGGLTHPDHWNRERTELFANHIWLGQQGGLDEGSRFQLQRMHEEDDEDNDKFQDSQDPQTTDNDPHAQAEVRSHLPGVPDEEAVRRPFTQEGYAELEGMIGESEVMIELLKRVQEYEQKGPIQAARGHWTRMYDTSTHFPAELPEPEASFEVLSGPWLSQQYFVDADLKEDSSAALTMRLFAYWLRSGLLVHPLTRTVLAGPWGVKWPALVLICAYWTGVQIQLGQQPPNVAKKVHMSDVERGIVLREAQWLIDSIEDSIGRLQTMYEAASQPFIPPVAGIDTFESAHRFAPPYLQQSDGDTDAEDEEDFGSFYQRMIREEHAARINQGNAESTTKQSQSKAKGKGKGKAHGKSGLKSALKRKLSPTKSAKSPPRSVKKSKVRFLPEVVIPIRKRTRSSAMLAESTHGVDNDLSVSTASNSAPEEASGQEWLMEDSDPFGEDFCLEDIVASIEASRVTAAQESARRDSSFPPHTPGASGSGQQDVTMSGFSPPNHRKKRARK